MSKHEANWTLVAHDEAGLATRAIRILNNYAEIHQIYEVQKQTNEVLFSFNFALVPYFFEEIKNCVIEQIGVHENYFHV